MLTIRVRSETKATSKGDMAHISELQLEVPSKNSQ